MQYDKQYGGVAAYKAITLSVEDADNIATKHTDHLLRKVSSPYRGEVLLVTKPHPSGERSGMIVGRAIISDIKRVEGGFLWKFTDAHRMVEFPAQKCGMKGEVWDCFYTANTLVDYPEVNLRPFLSIFK